MIAAATVILAMSPPILVVIGLFMLAAWRDHRRGAMVARQIRLSDAIADELGMIVAPVVAKPLGGPWRVEIRVPVGRPATVSRIVAIAHDTLTRTGAGQYELVLTPEPARVHTLGGATRPARQPGRPRHGEAAARPRRRGPPAAPPPDPGRDRTGKGFLARALHGAGPGQRGPLVEVNCVAIRGTLIEAELFGFQRGTFTDARQPRRVRPPITLEVIDSLADRVDDAHRIVAVNMDPTAITERLHAALAAPWDLRVLEASPHRLTAQLASTNGPRRLGKRPGGGRAPIRSRPMVLLREGP